jgi:hypothetical protein
MVAFSRPTLFLVLIAVLAMAFSPGAGAQNKTKDDVFTLGEIEVQDPRPW